MSSTKVFKKKRFYANEFGYQMKGDKDGLPSQSSDKKKQGHGGNKKISEYGRQLKEKQKVRFLYGVSERQFRRLFEVASKQQGIRGENLLITLERRLDNVVFRLKLAASRKQARQVVAHGHILVNGQRVKAPSYLVSENDVVALADRAQVKEGFVERVVEKRLNRGIKVPEWLELDKEHKKGTVVRFPLRSEIVTPIEEHLIVELYSK